MMRSFPSVFWHVTLCSAFWLVFSCSPSTQDNDGKNMIRIDITFREPQKGIVKLSRFSAQAQDYVEIHSSELNGKDLQFEVHVPYSEFYQLDFFGRHATVLVLESSDVQVTLQEQAGVFTEEVKGSPGTAYYHEAGEIVQEFQKQLVLLRQEQVDAQDTAQVRQTIEKKYAAIHQKSIAKLKAYIKKIIPNIVAIRALSILEPSEEIEFYRYVLDRMQAEAPDQPYTQSLSQEMLVLERQVETEKRLALGAPAPNLNLPSPEGQVLELQNLQGKLVLVDFWASWCKPCRMENPRVVKIYEKYHNQGFEILGVSLDQNREAWLSAIQEDGLSWLHVLDKPGELSQAYQLYNVSAIPSKYLVGPKGDILAKNLRGDALEEKIKEALQKL